MGERGDFKDEREAFGRAAPGSAEALKGELRVNAASKHAEHDAEHGDEAGFDQEGLPHLFRRPADGQQQAGLCRAKLQREEKQQRGKDEGRSDQKQAQTDEQAAKVHAALRRGISVRFEISRHEPDIAQSERGDDLLLQGSLIFTRIGKANGGVAAETVAPELLAIREADEALRRAFVVIPILFVLIANGLGVHRNARFPITAIIHVRNAWKLRRPSLVHLRVRHRQNTRDGEISRFLLQLAPQAHGVVFERERVADSELLIVRQPLRNTDF